MISQLRIGLLAALMLAVMAAGLLLLARVTPWHTDPDAYFAALHRLQAAEDVTADHDALTRAFFANVDRYGTRKWLYADIGYSLAAWSGLLAAAALLYRRTGLAGLTRAQRRPVLIAVATLVACGLIWTGFVAEAVQSAHRGLLPSWGDSLGIPIFEACVLALYLTPMLLLLALAPCLLRRRAEEGILMLKGRHLWSSALVSVLYAPFVLLGVMLISTAPETGGWASSVAGAMIVWLMLNARALAIGPKAARG